MLQGLASLTGLSVSNGPSRWSTLPAGPPLAPHDGMHGRITAWPLGTVHVLVAGEAAVDRPQQQAEQAMPSSTPSIVVAR